VGINLYFFQQFRYAQEQNSKLEELLEQSVLLSKEWETLRCNLIQAYNLETKLDEQANILSRFEAKIKLPAPETPLRVFIAVMSSYNNTKLRNIIRKTWAYSNASNWYPDKSKGQANLSIEFTIRFILGDIQLVNHSQSQTSLLAESRKFGDMVFLSGIQDSYFTLTDRLLELLSHVMSDYPSAFDFVLKTDDDSYVHVPHLRKLLYKLPKTKLYWGEMVVHGAVENRSKMLWYNPQYLRLNFHYATYAVSLFIYLFIYFLVLFCISSLNV
jgi:hypothetical protein